MLFTPSLAVWWTSGCAFMCKAKIPRVVDMVRCLGVVFWLVERK